MPRRLRHGPQHGSWPVSPRILLFRLGVLATALVVICTAALFARRPARPRLAAHQVLPESPAAPLAAPRGAHVPGSPPGSASTGEPVESADPNEFAPGSCLSFAPTSGDRHLTVFVDAGHGGIDPGAIGTTTSGTRVAESDQTLPVELDVAAGLRAAGFSVVLSRTTSSTVARLGPGDTAGGVLTIQGDHKDVAARDICADDAHADLLLGIYFDAGSSSTNAGCVTGYDAARPFAADNLRFANALQHDVLAAMNHRGWGIPDEGVLLDGYLGSAVGAAALAYPHLLLLGPAEDGYFDTPSVMPGALIEPLFITDPFEATIASNREDQKVIASGMAAAVEAYFSNGTS